jgi:hypothetical protein
VAEALSRSLEMYADGLPGAHELARVAHRRAVSLAAAHREDAGPREHLAD